MVSLLHVNEHEIVQTVRDSDTHHIHHIIRVESNLSIPYPIDRHHLLLSPQIIEEYVDDLHDILKVISVTIWNAAGHKRSFTYYDR